MASSAALQRAAQAWCADTTRFTEMDATLAEAFADILDEEWEKMKQPIGIDNMDDA